VDACDSQGQQGDKDMSVNWRSPPGPVTKMARARKPYNRRTQENGIRQSGRADAGSWRQNRNISPAKIVFHAAHHSRGVSVANSWDDNSDHQTALRARGPRQKVGAVVELPCGRDNRVLCVSGDGVVDGGSVNYEGYGWRREHKMPHEPFQAHGVSAQASRCIACLVGFSGGHAAQSRTSGIAGQAEPRFSAFLLLTSAPKTYFIHF
jgi:hypothetical protein